MSNVGDPKPGTFPYNVDKRAGERSSLGGRASRDKVKSITENNSKLEAKVQSTHREAWQEGNLQGRVTKRKQDGSFYWIGI